MQTTPNTYNVNNYFNFVRLADYRTVIRNTVLDKILVEDPNATYDYDTDSQRIEIEKGVIEEITMRLGHRYDMDKIFVPVQTYENSTQYFVGDCVMLFYTDYFDATTYNIGDRINYQGFIYQSTQNSNTGNLPTDTNFWTKRVLNGSLFTPFVASLGNDPLDSALSYTQSTTYLSNLETIVGWDRGLQTLYFKRDRGYIYIYSSATDRTNNTNPLGVVDYLGNSISSYVDPYVQDTQGRLSAYPENVASNSKPIDVTYPFDLPANLPIMRGSSTYTNDKNLTGYLKIIAYIPDGAEWEVSANGYFRLGDIRNQVILQSVLKKVVYRLMSLISPRDISEHRVIDLDTTDTFLREIARGTVSANLPLIISEPKAGNSIRFSNPNLKKFKY